MRIGLLLAVAWMSGCDAADERSRVDDSTPTDAIVEMLDAGPSTDASADASVRPDAGPTHDGGDLDGTLLDATPSDAARSDATPLDTAVADAAIADAAPQDVESSDAAPFDPARVEHEAEPVPTPEEIGLPPYEAAEGEPVVDGAYVLVQSDQARLLLIPEVDPITTLAGCASWVADCFAAHRDLDACVFSSPRCPMGAPDCCPAACFEQYAGQRRRGVEGIEAFVEVVFRDAACFPGVREMLGRAP